MKTLKANFTAGPDCMPAFLVNDCLSCLCQSVYVYNLIIPYAVFPTYWKVARVFIQFVANALDKLMSSIRISQRHLML